MLQNLDHLFQDFEVSKYTRAGKTLWLDNGFGERLLVNAIKPHSYYKLHKIHDILNKCETFEMIPYIIYIFLNRYMFGENRNAATEMMEKYDPDLMGKIALALFKHHRTNQIIYKFNEEVESLYENFSQV